ncbi:MAG TPA: hypothetical protein VEB64_15720 [Azospirillaceae bacterium]|nr:hypothetical protein [Azospirillaceae bacterium]
MLTRREAAVSIFGAWRLALFDPGGMLFLDRTPEGALRSFYAAALVLPGYIFLLAAHQWDGFSQVPLLPLVLVQGIAYVVRWSAYALVMYHIAQYLGRGAQYPGFLAAYNWSAVIQVIALVVVMVPVAGNLFPGDLGEAALFVVSMMMLVYQWFITRTALEVGGFMAFSLVLLDLILTEMISGIADSMLLGAG